MDLLHREHHRSPSVLKLAGGTRLAACAPLSQRVHMESDSPRSAVRRQVRAERERRGWTQTDLAAAAGVSRGSIANLERGTHLTEGTEARIETALGKPIGWLDELRGGRTPETVDFGEQSLQDGVPVDPATGTVGDIRREIAYFHGRFRDSPTDYERLLALVDLAVRLELGAPHTESGSEAGAQS
jgi:transcriptional regulator with XRE-family HTH domain